LRNLAKKQKKDISNIHAHSQSKMLVMEFQLDNNYQLDKWFRSATVIRRGKMNQQSKSSKQND
jgi:hypothetical protein